MVGVLYSVEEGPKRGGRGMLPFGLSCIRRSMCVWLVPWTLQIHSIFQSLFLAERVIFV